MRNDFAGDPLTVRTWRVMAPSDAEKLYTRKRGRDAFVASGTDDANYAKTPPRCNGENEKEKISP